MARIESTFEKALLAKTKRGEVVYVYIESIFSTTDSPTTKDGSIKNKKGKRK